MARAGRVVTKRGYYSDPDTTSRADSTNRTSTDYVVTSDIKPGWLNVVRRLQSACSGYSGHAVLSMKILVDGTGIPICWSEPDRTKVEPKSLSTDVLLGLFIE